MNDIKTSTILALAAAALVTAACDPYPKAPGGTPEVIRAVASGPTTLTELNGPFANQTTDIVIDDAVLDDVFFVWFNKEMDGRTIQAFPDTDPATGLPPLDPTRPNPAFPATSSVPFLPVENTCEVGRSPLATVQLPADASVCYASGSAQAGGILQASPAAFWDVGSYVVGGTVNDYQGIPLAFQATFNVTHKPVFIAPDPYTVDLAWANDPTAATFTIQMQQTDGSDPVAANWVDVGTNVEWAEPPVAPSNEIFRQNGLEPGGIYWFRVLPGGTANANSTPAAVELDPAPAVAARANPIIGTGPAANTVQISFSRIRGAVYRVEFAVVPAVPTDPPAPLVWQTATGPMTNPAGATLPNPYDPSGEATPPNPVVLNVAGLTDGTIYRFRVVPVFAGTDGTPTAQSAAVTVHNPTP